MVQFSVFSNLFLLAQLRKVINSPSLHEMREGKEILANELGVVFKPPLKPQEQTKGFNQGRGSSPSPPHMCTRAGKREAH